MQNFIEVLNAIFYVKPESVIKNNYIIIISRRLHSTINALNKI